MVRNGSTAMMAVHTIVLRMFLMNGKNKGPVDTRSTPERMLRIILVVNYRMT